MNRYIFKSKSLSKHLSMMLDVFNDDNFKDIHFADDLTNSKLIFAIELNSIGVELEVLELIESLRPESLSGSDAIILISSSNDLYSKSFAQQVIFLLNQLGCQFVGRPMVEAIKDLGNMITPAKVLNGSREQALLSKVSDLRERFLNFSYKSISDPKLLVIHTSNKATSNTLRLWEMAEKHIELSISEIHIENNEIKDCNGCDYDICSYFGKANSCIYKGKIIDEVFPKILECDALIILSPNYNDCISAQLMAVINRLTSLFTNHDFYDKTLFSVVVSGYSGSDCLAKQLISSLAINKQFRLPPHFSLTAIANEKGSLVKVDNIEEKAKQFANIIIDNL